MSDKTATAKAKKPVGRNEMSKFQWTLREMRVNKAAYVMIAPFFILFFI